MTDKSVEQILREHRQILIDRIENSHKIDRLFK
jgi:hypothetical protein